MLAPLLGVLAGAQHALTGPDHLAGVAPLAAGRGRTAWRVGASWGIGHVTGASVAALAALGLRAKIPGIEERLSGVSELVVGIALLVIGALGLRAAIRRRLTDVPHRHGPLVHSHWHARGEAGSAVDVAPAGAAALAPAAASPILGPARHRHAAFWLGTLHGAAGLSHIFLVLPALAFPGWWQPLLYLGGYGAGSLGVLTGFTALLGRLVPGDSERALRLSLGVASAGSVIVGASWIALSI